MQAYHDEIGKVDERSTERMSFRTKPRIKERFRRRRRFLAWTIPSSR